MPNPRRFSFPPSIRATAASLVPTNGCEPASGSATIVFVEWNRSRGTPDQADSSTAAVSHERPLDFRRICSRVSSGWPCRASRAAPRAEACSAMKLVPWSLRSRLKAKALGMMELILLFLQRLFGWLRSSLSTAAGSNMAFGRVALWALGRDNLVVVPCRGASTARRSAAALRSGHFHWAHAREFCAPWPAVNPPGEDARSYFRLGGLSASRGELAPRPRARAWAG